MRSELYWFVDVDVEGLQEPCEEQEDLNDRQSLARTGSFTDRESPHFVRVREFSVSVDEALRSEFVRVLKGLGIVVYGIDVENNRFILVQVKPADLRWPLNPGTRDIESFGDLRGKSELTFDRVENEPLPLAYLRGNPAGVTEKYRCRSAITAIA